MRGFRSLLCSVAVAVASPAVAQTQAPPQPASVPIGGLTAPIPLTEVLTRARINASLQLQIRLQLDRAQKKKDEIWCRATVLDSKWSSVSGQQVNPYVCPIGRRTVFLTGTLTFYDARGARLQPTDPELTSRTTKITESRFKWRWNSSETAAK